MGSPLSPIAARDAIRMVRIVFGDSQDPVMISNINSLAPLQFSFEKFFADEELCCHLLKTSQPVEISNDAINTPLIREVGVGGQYLDHRSTFERCRSEFLFLPLANRLPFDQWQKQSDNSYFAKAKRELTARLSEYKKPEIDPAIEKELIHFIEKRKEGLI